MGISYTEAEQKYRAFCESFQSERVSLGEEDWAVLQALASCSWSSENSKILAIAESALRKSGMEPGSYLKKYHPLLVELCVQEPYREDYYAILRKYNQFSYTEGPWRRTMRSKDYHRARWEVFPLLGSYFRLWFFGVSLPDYLENRLPEDKLEIKQAFSGAFAPQSLDNMIAGAIDRDTDEAADRGTGETAKAAERILLGDNNTAAISVSLIRGILKSSGRALHKLLGDFLLAARLQEGVRQAVCENMDCGTDEAFCTLFRVIYENGLIRYSSVKRAVGTWIGMMDYEHTDRVMTKVLDTIHGCLFTEGETERCLQSQDAIELITGLWRTGSLDVSQAVSRMGRYLEEGSRQQKLVMSYYNKMLSDSRFSSVTAKKVVAGFAGAETVNVDLEMLAAFMPAYLPDSESAVRGALWLADGLDMSQGDDEPLTLSKYFSGSDEAELHYVILKKALEVLTEKSKVYAPFLFPWYSISLSRSDIAVRLCLIAALLEQDEKKDEAAAWLSQIDSGDRGLFLRFLLGKPNTPAQRKFLLEALEDRGTETRKAAFEILKDWSFTGEEYGRLQEMLRLKNADLRRNVIFLLRKRTMPGLQNTLTALLTSPLEELRLAGLDMILQLKKEEGREADCKALLPLALALAEPTKRETVLLEEIKSKTADQPEGYGLFLQSDTPPLPPESVPFCEDEYPIFSISENRLHGLFRALDDFIHAHREERVTDTFGTEQLLGACGSGLPLLISYAKELAPGEQRFAFSSLWEEFYRTEIKDFPTLYTMYAAILPYHDSSRYAGGSAWDSLSRKLFGDAVFSLDCTAYRYGSDMPKTENSLFLQILEQLIRSHRDVTHCKEISKKICRFLQSAVPADVRFLKWKDSNYPFAEYYSSQPIVMQLCRPLLNKWDGQAEWKERYDLLFWVDKAYYQFGQAPHGRYNCNGSRCWLNPLDYIMAHWLGLLTSGQMYRILLKERNPDTTLYYLRGLGEKNRNHNAYLFEKYGLLAEEEGFRPDFAALAQKVLDSITDVILNVELKRGDTPTEMSEYVRSLRDVVGIKRLIQLLTALGKDKLERSRYHDADSKTGSLSHLLRCSRPAKEETAAQLKAALKESGISRQRLIETGMYAPKWLPLLEEALAFPGLQSGAYYFMAHMDTSVDEWAAAMIAKYTPLSREELRGGAFDIDWFRDVLETLGEERLGLLYNASKYTASGSAHTRARKFADASMGRVTPEDAMAEIKSKRNKDLLMALGLIPSQGKADMLHRYEFIRSFRKESRQFGAMRRSGEEHAADTALKNMATAAGYRDETRLILSMEAELTQAAQGFFSWRELDGGCSIRLEITPEGKAETMCKKGEKALKSIPSSLKKNEYVLALKETQTKLKEQYRRTADMLEGAMQSREPYTLEELRKLLQNPVAGPIVRMLVFTDGAEKDIQCGFVTESGFVNREGRLLSEAGTLTLYTAHPVDLYQSGEWPAFQKLFSQMLSEEKKRQPFRQVFRELYVKLEEERKQLFSRLFAGNQIQPKKTLACLKNRGWIADYEAGLQKVFYRENIIAGIYARADWFSPSDIEAPTLEQVAFTGRKSFRLLPVGEVPDILYSEVMRDVDMAVSVAHAGSVDPESSHSTIEMRRAIAACNVELFGLTNVKLEGSHAMITGKLGEFSIHLGSGIIHKLGGHQINVLPVHSQSRGRIFLPFLDEDPKTAEVISKILLFAQDSKIKDPFLLNQLDIVSGH